MSSVKKLDKIVADLVSSAPPGELAGVAENLNIILDGEQTSLVNHELEAHINESIAIYSDSYIVSKYNRDPSTSKYIDHVNKKLFNIDLATGKVIDVESYNDGGSVSYPSYFAGLVSKLEQYGEDHFPSSYAFTVIPGDNGQLDIIIVGQRLNNENFYTGQWKAHYKLSESQLVGDIKLDIHYYEDGNVRLNFDERAEESLAGPASGSSIVNAINKVESNATIKIMDQFNDLNQRSFKNLRRLLPVTRSKINWGKAIGNYRLGSDVVNSK
ncbi:F-actin-capping protein subunit alpha [[Candida] railenensis]|uniref:F-actin-capping protein subunit alpha n=1 Tax=[Candida] railenensis TaxID=45579 RepID=A0A9P0QJX4_9ASCO|nr:F-actin-capping protein subunit alpha [[Candida] railenensis]